MAIGIISSLRQVLDQVNNHTVDDTAIYDGKETKSRSDWLVIAEKTRTAATTSTKEAAELERISFALRYRVGALADQTPTLEGQLSNLFFPSGSPKEFEKRQIHHLCTKYPDFAQKLLENEEWALNFFKFAVQAPSHSSYKAKDATHWVDIFVQYPEIVDRLIVSRLYEKLSNFPENIKIIADRGVCLKVDLVKGIWVPFSLNWTTTLELKNRATNRAGIPLTLEAIFKLFETSSPDIDVGTDGIINLNSIVLGSKNEKGVIDRIDVNQWIDHLPSIEVDLPELVAKYPDLKDETELVFVLRAARGQTSRPFFDIVKKLTNGNYRIFSFNPGAGISEQKTIFYPLSEGQSKKVVEMVARDIEQCRAEVDSGKEPTPIDIGAYIDEILGCDFYDHLEKLAARLLGPASKGQIAEAKRTLDSSAFERFMVPLIRTLFEQSDVPSMHQLIVDSMKTLNLLSRSNHLPAIKEQDVRNAFQDAKTQGKESQFKQSLVQLTVLCFELLHPYRMRVADAETGFVKKLFQRVDKIPWQWLRNLLTNFLLFIFGPFRGYRYVPPANASFRSFKGIVQKIKGLVPEKYLNRQDQLFETHNPAALAETTERIKSQIKILAKGDTHV